MLSSVSFRRCKGTATFGLFQKIRRNLLRVVTTAPDSCDKAAANSLNVVAKERKMGFRCYLMMVAETLALRLLSIVRVSVLM